MLLAQNLEPSRKDLTTVGSSIILSLRTTLHSSKESHSHHGRVKKRDSCWDADRQLGVLTVTGLYLLEVICYARFHCEIPDNRSTNTLPDTIPNFVRRPQDWLWASLCLNLRVLC
ncbi:hypothetical protein J6590_072067 [Homalodisca vitripennis]|nr:hypothetical protein J6590_072067 [Homalodisca vitripennis]